MPRWLSALYMAFALAVTAFAVAITPDYSSGLRLGALPMARVDSQPVLSFGVRALDLAPGETGELRLDATVTYLTHDLWVLSRYLPMLLRRAGARQPWLAGTPLRRYGARVELLAGEQVFPLECRLGGWRSGVRRCALSLPEHLPNGDHRLRVQLLQSVQPEAMVELELPVYQSAWGHVLLDRPLARPGDTLRFRSLTLAARDGRPLEDRTGTWVLRDPQGRSWMQLDGRTDAHGVHQGQLPLGPDAPEGKWTVTWSSGPLEESAGFEVQRQALPVGELQLWTERSWYAPGEVPKLRASLRSASGAPLAGVTVRLRAQHPPDWPPPTEWDQERVTDAAGQLHVTLDPVPEDLPRPLQLTLRATALGLGTPIEASLGLPLSPTSLVAEGLSEAGPGLAAGLPNHTWVRVTHPDGAPVVDAPVVALNRWEPEEPAAQGRTDADGVALLRLAPRSVVQLPSPATGPRTPAAPPPALELLELEDLLIGGPAPMQAVQDIKLLLMELSQRCGVVAGTGQPRLTLLAPHGVVLEAQVPDAALGDCLQGALAGRRVPVGTHRLTLQANEPPHPRIKAEVGVERGLAPTLTTALERRARLAETCLAGAPERPFAASWRVRGGALELLQVSPGDWPSCVAQRLSGPVEAEDGWGQLLLSAAVPEPRSAAIDGRLQEGFEYTITAADLGSAQLTLGSTPLPELRLRPSARVLAPGQSFQVQALRGPQGEMPQGLTLQEQEVALQGGRATLNAPDLPGVYAVQGGGARAWVLVRDASTPMSLRLSDRITPPGAPLSLQVRGAPDATVSLVGLDSRVNPPALDALTRRQLGPAFSQAFGVPLIRVLMGQVTGEHAISAILSTVVLRDEQGRDSDRQDSSAIQMRSPYHLEREARARLKGALEDATWRWAAEAPPEQRLDNPRYHALWLQVLQEAERLGEPLVDSFGEPLWPSRHPDPRELLADPSRLPDDMGRWSDWLEAQ